MRDLVWVGLLVLGIPAGVAGSGPPTAREAVRVGAEFAIIRRYETSNSSSDGSSGSSQGSSELLERVVAVRPDGVELEYDLPVGTSDEDREREWMFPARIFKSVSGSTRLLNPERLEGRLANWLAKAKWDRTICGRWIFTWNAFKIECDPAAVLDAIAAYDLRSTPAQEGMLYASKSALGPSPLSRKNQTAAGLTLVAKLIVSPEAVRRQRAEAAVVVAQLTGQPKNLEAALAEQTGDQITGTIEVTLDVNLAGQVTRRTEVTEITTRKPSGATATESSTNVTERRPTGSSHP